MTLISISALSFTVKQMNRISQEKGLSQEKNPNMEGELFWNSFQIFLSS